MDIASKESIKAALFHNLEKISGVLWQPDLQGWKIWVTGKLGSKAVSISSPLTQGTCPNPANYSPDEWLLELPFWSDIPDLSGEEMEEADFDFIIMDYLINNLDVLAEQAIFPAVECEA